MGVLYIVPTPVGNMEDMTMRAIRILNEVDLILAEDTRTSSKLLHAREASKAGITVQTLPGATACIPAIVSSGLPCDRFCFEGFLPQKKGRQTHLESLRDEVRTMIFYESPYRLLKTLQQFSDLFGPERQVSVAREISKVHEESVRGTMEEVINHFKNTAPRGEIVIVVAGKTKNKKSKTEEI